MKKNIILLVLLLISFFSISNSNVSYASTTGLTFTYDDNYETTKAFEAMPKTFEAIINIPNTVSTNPGIIYSNLGYNTFEDCYSFEVRYADNKAYPLVYFDVNNVNDVNIEPVLFEFREVNLASSSKIQVAITIDTSDPKLTIASCYLNGYLVQKLEKSLPEEYNNLEYVPVNPGKMGGCYDGKFGLPYDTYQKSTHFNGELYKLSFYKDVRTVEEIGLGVNLKDNDLLAHYEVDSNSKKQDINDLSKNNYDIKYSNIWFDKEPASDYAYSFALVGDTQSLCELHTQHMQTMYQWIVDNVEDKKIAHVFGLGDITEGDADWEWVAAKNAISLMDGVVPYSLIRGNHDTTPKLNKTFANDTYMNQFTGFYKENDINASYKLFTAGKVNYLLITLNYGAFDEELEWACKIIEKYPERKVIITTHNYLYSTGQRIDANSGLRPKTSNDDDYKYKYLDNSKVVDSDYNNGDDIWDKLVSKYGNIQFVISGHVDTPHVVTSQAVGIHGNTVTQMLVNPQDMDKAASQGNVPGYGMVCMLYFNEDGTEVQVEYYSTVKEKYFLTKNVYTIDISNSGNTAHNYQYKNNSIFHWMECECGKKDLTTQTKHTYESGCDAVCDCGYTRTASDHTFVDGYDEEGHFKICSVCQEIDEDSIKVHVYDNDCDDTCNSCDYQRSASHKYTIINYDNLQHWVECANCGKTNEVSDHIFEHGCDKDCESCEYTRETEHDYSIMNNDGKNYWKECSICKDRIAVDPPKKGCNGSIGTTIFSLIILVGIILILKNVNRRDNINMNKGKKILNLLMVLVLSLSVAACNQAGPQGEQGPKGEQGPQGEAGKNGTPWLTGEG